MVNDKKVVNAMAAPGVFVLNSNIGPGAYHSQARSLSLLAFSPLQRMSRGWLRYLDMVCSMPACDLECCTLTPSEEIGHVGEFFALGHHYVYMIIFLQSPGILQSATPTPRFFSLWPRWLT